MDKPKNYDRDTNSADYDKEVDLDKMNLYWNEMAEDAMMQIAHAKNEEEFETRAINNVDTIMDYLGKFNIDITKSTILDVGCGIGRMVKEFRIRFGEGHQGKLIGVDVSQEMINKGAKYCEGLTNLTLIKNSGADLKDIDDNSVDVVYSYITFQHVPRKLIKGYVKEIARVLKKGGLAVLHFGPLAAYMMQNEFHNPMEPPNTNYRWMRYYKMSEAAEACEEVLYLHSVDEKIFVVGEKKW